MMKYNEMFLDALKNRETEICIDGEEFLLCPHLNSTLTYKLNYLNDVVSISAKYESEFEDIQTTDILKRRCVLNKTFKDVHLNMESDCEIGVESLEYGTFDIRTKSEAEFSICDDDYSDAVRYMMLFMQIIAIADNAANA